MKGMKTGGRVKGTPNKRTKGLLEPVENLLRWYVDSGLLMEDFKAITSSRDRIVIAEKLLQYNIPKKKSTSVDLVNSGITPVEEMLRALAEEESK